MLMGIYAWRGLAVIDSLIVVVLAVLNDVIHAIVALEVQTVHILRKGVALGNIHVRLTFLAFDGLYRWFYVYRIRTQRIVLNS